MLPRLIFIISLKIILLSMVATALGEDASTVPTIEGVSIEDMLVKGCPASLFGNSRHTESDGKTQCSRRQIPQDAEENLPEYSNCQILVFVSFSMPEASLKSLGQEATRDSETPCRPILVMRGLYQDSFAKTAEKLKNLGIAVEINPELFETHQVTTVPTFVFVRDGKSLHHLRGNVTLTFASKTFAEQGDGELIRSGGAP